MKPLGESRSRIAISPPSLRRAGGAREAPQRRGSSSNPPRFPPPPGSSTPQQRQAATERRVLLLLRQVQDTSPKSAARYKAGGRGETRAAHMQRRWAGTRINAPRSRRRRLPRSTGRTNARARSGAPRLLISPRVAALARGTSAGCSPSRTLRGRSPSRQRASSARG